MSQHGAMHARRRRLLLAFLVLAGAAVLGRGFQLQVLQASEWADRAAGQQREQVPVPAERGTIYDRNGVPIATTRQMIRVSVAPREVTDRDAVADALRRALGVSRDRARSALDRSRRWVVLPGKYDPTVRGDLARLDGVYLEPVLERFHPHGDLALEVVGRVSPDGRALDGLELELDSLLRGEDGVAVVRRDAHGDPIPGALMPVREPRSGHSVYLTIDLGLQEIAYEALRQAVEENAAVGGDLIFADPRTGEVLAAATVREEGSRHWRGVTDPYEPGSTIKPFMMAALLDRGRVALDDSVYAEEGHYRMGGRVISDVHGRGWITAADVLRYSSNVGMVKLAERLEPEEQYGLLRDFGFGTPTGVTYPSESGGRLARPDEWSGYTGASMAIGYEVLVTPLQMTMAYGALANGGTLYEPELLREIRSPIGEVVARGGKRALRRAVPRDVATQVATTLGEVVEDGTGQQAGLGEFRVAGKTGTTRIFEAGGYRSDIYTASFAGFFPARAPQLVFLVKLDRAAQYGGSVAAPVTRATLAAALAARTTPLDRSAVLASLPDPGPRVTAASIPVPGLSGPWLPPAHGPFVFRVDAGPPVRLGPPSGRAAVPDVRGESVRDAAAALHAAGFRVRVEGAGRVRQMEPGAGSAAVRGSEVRLVLGRSR